MQMRWATPLIQWLLMIGWEPSEDMHTDSWVIKSAALIRRLDLWRIVGVTATYCPSLIQTGIAPYRLLMRSNTVRTEMIIQSEAMDNWQFDTRRGNYPLQRNTLTKAATSGRLCDRGTHTIEDKDCPLYQIIMCAKKGSQHKSDLSKKTLKVD